MPEVSRDAILGLGLTLTQPKSGHRVGADAVLLAAAAGPPVKTLVDVGAGVGSVGLALLRRWPEATGEMIEIDPELAEFSRTNAEEAGMQARAKVLRLDVFDKPARRAVGLKDGAADLVVTNPPFYDRTEVRISPDESRARAHVLVESLENWVVASLALLKPGGRFVMIHRPDGLNAILAGIGKRLGGVAIRPVYPKAETPAIRILVSGVKGSRAPLAIFPGLILHEADGRFTPEAAAIHRGEAQLSDFR